MISVHFKSMFVWGFGFINEPEPVIQVEEGQRTNRCARTPVWEPRIAEEELTWTSCRLSGADLQPDGEMCTESWRDICRRCTKEPWGRRPEIGQCIQVVAWTFREPLNEGQTRSTFLFPPPQSLGDEWQPLALDPPFIAPHPPSPKTNPTRLRENYAG